MTANFSAGPAYMPAAPIPITAPLATASSARIAFQLSYSVRSAGALHARPSASTHACVHSACHASAALVGALAEMTNGCALIAWMLTTVTPSCPIFCLPLSFRPCLPPYKLGVLSEAEGHTNEHMETGRDSARCRSTQGNEARTLLLVCAQIRLSLHLAPCSSSLFLSAHAYHVSCAGVRRSAVRSSHAS